jgi:hypothetical protein
VQGVSFQEHLKRNPDRHDENDLEIMDTIWRANLDTFWSRETSMVGANLNEVCQMERMAMHLGLPLNTLPLGPRDLQDNLGMKAALAILDRSLDEGIYEDTVQWDTF